MYWIWSEKFKDLSHLLPILPTLGQIWHTWHSFDKAMSNKVTHPRLVVVVWCAMMREVSCIIKVKAFKRGLDHSRSRLQCRLKGGRGGGRESVGDSVSDLFECIGVTFWYWIQYHSLTHWTHGVKWGQASFCCWGVWGIRFSYNTN